MDHQEEFLYSFFNQVSQLCFDKAKESVEKEKESCKSTQMGPWGMLLIYLPQIIIVERSYSDLGFLQSKNKGFLRKDNSLKTIYDTLRSDFKKLEEVTGATDLTVIEVSSQLCSFITARINLIEFYEKLYHMSINNKVMRFEELLQIIENIAQEQSVSCSHLVLTAIKAALILECDILVQLMKAQIHVQKWHFLPSIKALYDAQTRMAAWEKTLQSREINKSWKLGFGATFLKVNQPPALYQWLLKLRCTILSKFSLYFYATLYQQANSGEIRNIMSKQSTDYYHKMQSFQRKYDVIAIAIVFDSQSCQDSGPSYRHPKRELDSSDMYSFIISCPCTFMQKPTVHWNAIKKCIEEHYNDLLLLDKVIFVKSPKDIVIYAFLNIDSNTTLVTIYENNKQKDKESHVITFMTDLCVQIRGNKIYESLKLSK